MAFGDGSSRKLKLMFILPPVNEKMAHVNKTIQIMEQKLKENARSGRRGRGGFSGSIKGPRNVALFLLNTLRHKSSNRRIETEEI